ncbi:PLP-dependent aminotransferase family protein [Bacteroidota bacterium]
MVDFSRSVSEMRSSEIRDLMSSATDPNMISFAGGMPNNDLFPVDEVNELYNNLPQKLKQVGFQYGPTTGFPPLVDTLREYLRGMNLPVDTNEIMITAGSMQAISIAARVYLDPGDIVITEMPCFIGAIAAFKAQLADIRTVPMDEDGLIIDELDKVFRAAERKPKMIYLSPYFHNPAGIVYSKERKAELLHYLKDKDIIMLEDDPYSELYFDDDVKKLMVPMKCTQPEPVPIMYTGTFSKILGPGMRLGWLLCRKDIFQKCDVTKQSIDACSSTFTQVIADAYVKNGMLKSYVARMREVYKRRMEITVAALEKYMPEGVTWVKPRGGFYVWLTLPEYIDATEVLKKSIPNGALFVVGKTFDPAGKINNNIRLSYSYPAEENLEKGVKIIADALKATL